ncbi:MAG TPA: tetratricopeptide repeat protein [Bryobacteraceae bacterium]|jgi:hypothetical protein|nr:tetratricopeptide repeat protein [Bryobacteraceae bacterium]
MTLIALVALAGLPLRAADEYVGSLACARCHRQIYLDYAKTDMGRSMSAGVPNDIPRQGIVHDEKLNRYFAVSQKPDGVYQSEYATADGAEVFRNEQKIAYSIGAGRNGISFLVDRGGFLLQTPLSYYSQTRSWGISPGFEGLDIAFNRPALPACLSCHAGSPKPQAPGAGQYATPPFQELNIGCENCHGPGGLHIAEREGRIRPTPSVKAGSAGQSTIVNPAKLSPWLADNICMNCHQGRTLRILQPGKTFQDFRPGTPLHNSVAIFATPLTEAEAGASFTPLLEHYSLMTMSKCYTSSGGRLSCITCHDPHVQPEAEPVNYFRAKCLSCHQESSCALSLTSRRARVGGDNCVECHMPRTPVNGIAHSVLTNHRIVRNDAEPFPTALFNSSKPRVGGLIYLNAEPGQAANLSDLTLFRAYTELASSKAEYLSEYVSLLHKVENEFPQAPEVLSGLGWLKMGSGQEKDAPQAIEYLERAIDSGTQRVEDYQALANLLTKAGQVEKAIAVLERGAKIAPYDERFYKSISLAYMSIHDYDNALKVMRDTVKLFPEDDFMRSLLEKAEQANRMR